MEKNERMPIPTKKVSLFRKLYNKLFLNKLYGESEISKIAECLSKKNSTILDTVSKTQYVPDKRTIVYDFFDNLKNHDYYRGKRDQEFSETITFTSPEGYKREFSLYTDAGRLIQKIGINGIEMLPYIKGWSDGLYYEEITINSFKEMIELIEYDKFVNNNKEDTTFVDEMGRIITEVSEKFGFSDVAGKKIYRLLNKNPIYSSTKDSFDKAYREYYKTVGKFRNDERDRKEQFDKKISFSDEIKVENIEKLKHSDSQSIKKNRDTERAD